MKKTIRIKSDPASAAKAINTNRPLKVGDTLECDAATADMIVSKHGHLFEYMVPIVQTPKDAPAKPQEHKQKAPGKNKKLAKSAEFKTKV